MLQGSASGHSKSMCYPGSQAGKASWVADKGPGDHHTFSSSGVMYSCCSGSIGPPRACEGSSFFTPMRFSICSSTYFCLYIHEFRVFNRQIPTCAEQLQDVQATHRAMHLQSGSSQCQKRMTRPARLTCADPAPHPQTPALAPLRRSLARRSAAAHPAPMPARWWQAAVNWAPMCKAER